MNDYKELVARLRAIGEHLKFDKTSCVYLAADAIEQLVNDYEILAKMYAKANVDLCVRTKERDAAVADLKEFCDCGACVSTHDMCDTCLFGSNWEWRGVQNE